MGIVKGNWLLPSHSGRACHHDDIYTKMNKKTGKCYSVKLCNPSDTVTANQTAQRTKFGAESIALNAWINANKVATATDHATYMAVKAAFDRQCKYATLRGYMMAKGMAVMGTNGVVTITIGTYTATVTNGVVGSGSNTSGGGNTQGGDNQGGDNQGGGDNPGGGGTQY